MDRGQFNAAAAERGLTLHAIVFGLLIFACTVFLATPSFAQDEEPSAETASEEAVGADEPTNEPLEEEPAPPPPTFDDGYAAYQRGNFYEARTIWEQLGTDGDARSLYNLGSLYAEGRGVSRDLEIARGFWRQAALTGHVRAMHNLALGLIADAGMREEEIAAEVYDLAVQWLSLAAETGFPNSQYTLGKMFQYGLSVEQNDEEAARLFTQAADQGFASAQYNMGKLYRDGRGVPRDTAQSIRYFELAAFQGHAGAQNRMATRYARGDGVNQDDVTALMWATLSADQGNERGQENRDVMLARMSAEDIAVTEEMIEAYRAAR